MPSVTHGSGAALTADVSVTCLSGKMTTNVNPGEEKKTQRQRETKQKRRTKRTATQTIQKTRAEGIVSVLLAGANLSCTSKEGLVNVDALAR